MAKTYTTVQVTQEDIDRAMRKQSARCVVATAIARSFPGASKVAVDLQAIRFTLDGERHVYFTPPDAQGYVVAFDAGDDIHPFKFKLSENHRLPATPNRPRTPAGLKRKTAQNSVRRPKARVERAEQAVEQATSPAERETAEAQLVEARQVLVEAEQARDQVLAETAGQVTHTTNPTRANIPTTFRRGTRHYGMRELRVNRGDDDSAKANMTASYDAWSPAPADG